MLYFCCFITVLFNLQKDLKPIHKSLYCKKMYYCVTITMQVRGYKVPTRYFYILVPEPFWHLICINFLQWCISCIKFECWTILHQTCCQFSRKLKKRLMQELHNPVLLFGTNIVSSISTKALKKSTISKARLALFLKIKVLGCNLFFVWLRHSPFSSSL